jgi:translation initiation factor 2B subunit (eIF-2B alpha/beta/delta family)
MAALVNLLNAVVKAARGADELPAARRAAAQTARAFVQGLEEQHVLIARLGGALLRRDSTVLTHSYSSLVVGALLRAHESGRAPRVICTESRPRCEGTALARRLHTAGLATTLVLDSAVFDALGEADLVLLGADSLALPGVYNKVGTAGLAWAASVRGTPCYVLAGTGKLWPAELGVPPHILEHAAAEVWPDAPEGVRVINRYFDVTPWSALSGVVSEQGLLSAEGVVRMIQDVRVDEALLGIV